MNLIPSKAEKNEFCEDLQALMNYFDECKINWLKKFGNLEGFNQAFSQHTGIQ